MQYRLLNLTLGICFFAPVVAWVPLFMLTVVFYPTFPFIGIIGILIPLTIAVAPGILLSMYLLRKLSISFEDIALFFILGGWGLGQTAGLICFSPGLKHTLLAMIIGGSIHLGVLLAFRFTTPISPVHTVESIEHSSKEQEPREQAETKELMFVL